VFFRDGGEEPLGQKSKSLEFVATEGQRQDSYVNGAGAEAVEKYGRNFFDDGESNLGEFTRESSQARRKEIRGNGGYDTDGDRTADELFAFDYVAPGGFQFAKDGAGAREKRFAEFGEPDGAPEAVEEASAEFVFQFEDLLRKRRLGNVRLFCGAAERAGFGHGAEVAELVEFHRADQ